MLSNRNWIFIMHFFLCTASLSCAMLYLITQSCLTLWDPIDCILPGSSVHWASPGKNTGVVCHAVPSADLPNPGIKPSSPTLQDNSLPSEPPGKPQVYLMRLLKVKKKYFKQWGIYWHLDTLECQILIFWISILSYFSIFCWAELLWRYFCGN